MLGPEEITRRFGSTAKTAEPNESKHIELRREFIRLAQLIDVSMFDGREKSLAFTHLEDAAMWAQKALATSLGMKGEGTI